MVASALASAASNQSPALLIAGADTLAEFLLHASADLSQSEMPAPCEQQGRAMTPEKANGAANLRRFRRRRGRGGRAV